jgi:hypothetical protein
VQNFHAYFRRRAKEWCESLSVASIHTWDQFVSDFFYEFQDYDYDKICLELENLRRLEGESMIHFVIRFKLICLKFYPHDKPSDDDLTDWIVYLCSLPCIKNSYEESENFSFLSVHSTVNVTNDSFEFTNNVDTSA